MNDIVHAELSWLAAWRLQHRRDRILVVIAGVAPDLDGLPVLVSHAAYEEYHHVLFHSIFGALLTAIMCGAAARSRWVTAAFAFGAFHLHLLCDLAGSGVEWPFAYFWPVSHRFYGWSGAWDLASWQNEVFGAAVTLAAFGGALIWNRTFVEVFSSRADAEVTSAIRRRFRRATRAASAPR
jgi:hypothetical protein